MRRTWKLWGNVAVGLLLLGLWAGCSTPEEAASADPEATAQTSEATQPSRSVDDGGPKRIILLIGDGMGASAQTAATYAAGRPLAMTSMPHLNYITTHSWEFVTTDSAASATAFSTGHKTHYEGVSVKPGTTKAQETDPAFQFRTLIQEAEDRGWKTGLVATARITHATPAAFAAHRANRNSYEAIAEDLRSSGVDVLLGGGRRHFADREDGRDLLSDFSDAGYAVVDDAAGVRKARQSAGQLIGLLDQKDPPPMQAEEPRKMSLTEMTSSALSVLDRDNEEGFFLMVEGSQIDWEGHELDGPGVIEETLDFDRAVARALEYARDRDDTLVVTVADHETGGLGVYDSQDAERYLEALGGPEAAEEKVAYGPEADAQAPKAAADLDVGGHEERGAKMTSSALDLSGAPEDRGFSTMFGHLSVASRAGIKDAWDIYGTHTPELIPLWAEGPGAQMVTAATDNTHLGSALKSLIAGTAEVDKTKPHAVASGRGGAVPKSVILFIGDGMGLDAMTAAAYHGGALAMRDLPVRGMMATHAADRIVGDEASTATAIATGRRTKRGYVGVGPDGGDLQSALERGAAREMRTGIVTDGSVTGETLGAFYNGSDEAAPTQEALSKDLERVDVVLGPGDDSLASMTREAIRRLSQDGKPFFLVVESDKIGKLQRSMNRDAAVPEAVRDFDRAVRAGIDFARDDGETLVVALGDRDYSLTVLDDHYAFPDGACQAAQRCGGPYKMSEVGVDARGLDGVEGFDDRDLQGDYAPPTLLMQYGWAEQEAAFQAEDGSVQGPATANFTPLFAGGPGASRLAGMIDQPAVGQFLVDWASK